MTPSQFSQLKAVIQKANPEINNKGLAVGQKIIYDLSQLPITEDWWNGADEQVRSIASDVFYQAGDPGITLADVLLAIEKEERKGLKSPNLKRLSEFSDIQILIDLWNLSDDNLDHQSEETKEFLIKLLLEEKK